MTQIYTSKDDVIQSDAEISLLDIYLFFKNSYKTILILGGLGLGLATLYLLLTPNRYEATAQIQMAQIVAPSNISNPSLLGINIEEPALLISRLASPASYTQQEAKACGLEGQQDAGSILAKSIKVSPIKNVGNVVELKVLAPSPQVAFNCANAVFEMIKASQFQIVAPYIAEAKVKMADDQKRLFAARQLIANADKSGQAISASYLSTRDEVRFLLDEIAGLQNLIASADARTTNLVSPIYAVDIPIAPQKRLTLLNGLIGGVFLGILLALARKVRSEHETR